MIYNIDIKSISRPKRSDVLGDATSINLKDADKPKLGLEGGLQEESTQNLETSRSRMSLTDKP